MSVRRNERGGNDRVCYLVLALLALLVLGVARALTPSLTGEGTHEQLGLPPCTFHLITGHGCPGCGLTTSFAFLARGELASAFRVNPVGVLIFVAVVLSVPFFAYRVARPAPIDDFLGSPWVARGLVSLMVLMFVVWFVRLAIGAV